MIVDLWQREFENDLTYSCPLLQFCRVDKLITLKPKELYFNNYKGENIHLIQKKGKSHWDFLDWVAKDKKVSKMFF